MKRKFDGIIAATFLTTMFYSATYPYIHKYIVSIIPDSFIAGQQIVNCISIILFGWIWNKLPDKLFRWFPVFCILEFITTISATSFIILTGNVAAYYILDTVFFAIVTRNIVCGIFKLRARRYIEDATTIDAQPVKRGQWSECWRDPVRNIISVICSACGDASIAYLPKRDLTVDDVPKKI